MQPAVFNKPLLVTAIPVGAALPPAAKSIVSEVNPAANALLITALTDVTSKLQLLQSNTVPSFKGHVALIARPERFVQLVMEKSVPAETRLVRSHVPNAVQSLPFRLFAMVKGTPNDSSISEVQLLNIRVPMVARTGNEIETAPLPVKTTFVVTLVSDGNEGLENAEHESNKSAPVVARFGTVNVANDVHMLNSQPPRALVRLPAETETSSGELSARNSFTVDTNAGTLIVRRLEHPEQSNSPAVQAVNDGNEIAVSPEDDTIKNPAV